MNWSMKQWFDRCLILDIRDGLSTQVYYRLIHSVLLYDNHEQQLPLTCVVQEREGFSAADAGKL